MATLAARGESLVFFPEGTFRREPGLLPFRMGAFIAAVTMAFKTRLLRRGRFVVFSGLGFYASIIAFASFARFICGRIIRK